MRRAWVVVLGLVATIAAACSNGTEPKVTSANPLADTADQVMFGISTMITDQGLLRAKLAADTAYFFDGSTRIEARHEKTTFYTTTGVENAVLTSIEGTYNQQRGTMEARKNVVVVTTDNKRLETSLLDYNQQTNIISSDSAFVLTQPTGVMHGIGFTSDPNMTNLHVKRVITGGGTFTLPTNGTSP
ncbi:MAG TPA: LPS export ABC transporter periplasmic protein LptC [Gemmatimonadaceae bacterium]|nr:LPS export ABC transporter periplasmic protein LptC [Gemmatimonadaceae bacterium]